MNWKQFHTVLLGASILALLSFFSSAPAAYSQGDSSRRDSDSLGELREIPRLFNVPTARTLKSLQVYFTGGGAFGIETERSFLGIAALGLGDIAEIEVSTQSVINTLKQGSSTIPTSAFKMRLLKEGDSNPAAAVAFRSSTRWKSLEDASAGSFFQTRLTKLYLVASKRVGRVSGHFGLGLTDVRVRNLYSWSSMQFNREELQKNLWAPFGGFAVQANSKASIMFEIEGLPSFNFSSEEPRDASKIENTWAGVIGVRFYFTDWLIADTGVRYRSDFDGIADATIQANMNVMLPVGKSKP